MIHDAAQELEARGFNIEQKLEDDYGCIGYLLTFVGSRYVLVAKEYSHNNLASFMARLVEHAADDIDFIFYNYDDDSYTVFDGPYLKANAARSSGPSKQRDCSWREITLADGADLDAYIRGEDRPETLAGDNMTLDGFSS